MKQAGSEENAKRPSPHLGASAALGLVGLLIVWISCLSTFQILQATLWPRRPAVPWSCKEGIARFFSSVETARESTPQQGLSEQDALAHFRSQLQPSWQYFPTISHKCRKLPDRGAQRALRSVELLRYAEEKAVRLQSTDLAPIRRKTSQLVKMLSPAR